MKTAKNSMMVFKELDLCEFKDIDIIVVWENIDNLWSDIEFIFKDWSSEWYSFRNNWENIDKGYDEIVRLIKDARITGINQMIKDNGLDDISDSIYDIAKEV